MSLEFKFIANACGIFTGREGTRLLCDPWVVNGVFEGSWCHPFKLKTKPSDLEDVDAIYISHLHPDHLDERFFKFEKNMEIFILDREPNFLFKKLNSMGFSNIKKVKNEQSVLLNELELTLFSPFSKNNFHTAEIGNIIDSAILVSCEGVRAFNSNDNRLTPEYAELLHQKYGSIDFALLNYNSAGPYPSCFKNLELAEKQSESNRLINRNLSYLLQVIKALKPASVMPFAGAYVLGGSLAHKNEYLGTISWDECAARLREHLPDSEETKVITLREGRTIVLPTLQLDEPYIPLNNVEIQRYIQEELSKISFPYKLDSIPNESKLAEDIQTASSRMIERMSRYGILTNFKVILHAFGTPYQILPEFRITPELAGDDSVLQCWLDERLLRRILDRRAYWNNAEIGAHIEFFRHPNSYQPDLHLGLQFLHL